MTKNTRRLVTKLVRMQNAVEFETYRIHEAFAYDSAFDGGEFCGSALQRDIEREEHEQALRAGFATFDAAMLAARALRCVVNTPYHVVLSAAAPLPR